MYVLIVRMRGRLQVFPCNLAAGESPEEQLAKQMDAVQDRGYEIAQVIWREVRGGKR
jgi:hypothetical protein